MTINDLRGLPVPDVAAKNAVLLMWAIDPLLPEAIALGTHWGFRYKTVGFYWVKRRRVTSKRGRSMLHPDHREFPMSTGYWTRANPEPCLLFTRGKPKRLSASVRKLIIAPRREHSRKPDEQYDRIEALCEGPRLEMFARQSQPGWSSWGNQVDRFMVDAPLFDGAAGALSCHAERSGQSQALETTTPRLAGLE